MAPQSGTLAALASLSRSAYQYPGHRDPQTALRQRMCESAATRLRCGYRKIRVLLLREGYRASKNRLYRLYREEGLSLRYRPNCKRRAQMSRPARAKSTAANQVWSLDFVADQLSSSRGGRALTRGSGYRNLYWVIRNTRRGIHDAKRRRVYYEIAEHKKGLLMAGVSKEMILGLLRCCRTRDCQGQGCFDCPNRRDQSTYVQYLT